MPRYALTLEWDGRPFVGWQRQSSGASVQAVIEDAAAQMTGESVTAFAAGRTDAGVHARGMRAHIELVRAVDPFRLMEALNGLMRPAPIAVIGCEAVADDWHARFSCIGRAYDYVIVNRRAPLTFDAGFAWRVAESLDAGAMHEGAQHLVGRHDFTTFRSAHCQSLSPVKGLDRLDVRREGERVIVRAEARSFLHHQVRSMVGCLMMVGRGQWTPDDMRTALEARDRGALGLNAPPDGLFFMAARYP